MDPRQRSADRRRFVKIGAFILVGLGFIGLAALGKALGLEPGTGGRGYPPEFGFVLGAIWIGVAMFDLGRRLVSGPTKPGKRARY
jgi:hypothetical protein